MAWSKTKTVVVAGVIVLAVAGIMMMAFKHSQRSHSTGGPPPDLIRLLESQPGRALTQNAADFLAGLKRNGLLPGFSTNENAKAYIMIENLYQDTNSVWQVSHKDTDSYPATRTLHASKNNNGQFVFYYTAVKDSETANWRLARAWRVNGNGRLVEEFSLP